MATIKPIEGHSVHRIQSGQVIVDLSSVVKELVENSLDAGATSIDVRFRNHGLEAIEVQDNGEGISKNNYETVALKHYTSKLSSYDDLTSLQTFGFRGEALSSLCALSGFHVVTARSDEAPRGTRLDFEMSGKLMSTSVVASQKGTTVIVENLFMNLPVRRRELEKNIKREYGKVLGILQAYACISLDVKLAVSNQMPKGKKIVVFATKSNPTTRENIANIFGAKALPALIALDLKFHMQPSTGPTQERITQRNTWNKQVRILGHISRPIFGEGRQTPDRQMFFVNARPCGLPQVARAFNDVYKSYNISQSPFVFANLLVDTNAYDVNVSPDKRTILLHDQGALLESLKTSLIELFEKQDQTVPQSQRPVQKLPLVKQFIVSHNNSARDSPDDASTTPSSSAREDDRTSVEQRASEGLDPGTRDGRTTNLIHDFLGRKGQDRVDRSISKNGMEEGHRSGLSRGKQKLIKKLGEQNGAMLASDEYDDARGLDESETVGTKGVITSIPVLDFNQCMAEQQPKTDDATQPTQSPSTESQGSIQGVAATTTKAAPGVVQNAFERMRPRRSPLENATITIGPKTFTSTVGSPLSKRHKVHEVSYGRSGRGFLAKQPVSQNFSSTLQAFNAPGTLAQSTTSEDDEEPDDKAEHHRNIASEDATSQWANEVDDAAAAAPAKGDVLGGESDAGEYFTDHSVVQEDEGSADEYMDEGTKKAREEKRVAQLIQEAEEKAAKPSRSNTKRAHYLSKGGGQKDSTTQLVRFIDTSIERITAQLGALEQALKASLKQNAQNEAATDVDEETAEERLSLTVSKGDFANMRIVGQFNLGFILATRPSQLSLPPNYPNTQSPSIDELFIVDQHASDEKYNFECLQASTIVQNQRLVKPRTLDLTAIEEEIVLENLDALLKNGFLVEVDQSGDEPVGQRCKLVSLPMSREVTFNTRDLEELLALLAESPTSTLTALSNIPRPSKVRRMFAMRACRSSVMIGKTLTLRQMERLVRNMGTIEKPWNCPHGRPTMRHLAGLGDWEGWKEGEGIVGIGEEIGATNWKLWLDEMEGGDHAAEIGELEDDDGGDEDSME